MKQQINKLNKQQKQDLLCEVVTVFIENGISDNESIVKMCYELNTDKLRGVKRSLTLKKQKSFRKKIELSPKDHVSTQEMKKKALSRLYEKDSKANGKNNVWIYFDKESGGNVMTSLKHVLSKALYGTSNK